MEEPSKGAPSSRTLWSWRSGISTILRFPRMSVNHSWMCFTFSSATSLLMVAWRSVLIVILSGRRGTYIRVPPCVSLGLLPVVAASSRSISPSAGAAQHRVEEWSVVVHYVLRHYDAWDNVYGHAPATIRSVVAAAGRLVVGRVAAEHDGELPALVRPYAQAYGQHESRRPALRLAFEPRQVRGRGPPPTPPLATGSHRLIARSD